MRKPAILVFFNIDFMCENWREHPERNSDGSMEYLKLSLEYRPLTPYLEDLKWYKDDTRSIT
jgi:hypothetical protein